MPPASMASALRAVRQVVLRPGSGARRQPEPTRLAPRIVLRGGTEEGIAMDRAQSGSGVPIARPMTASQPVITRRAVIGGGLAGLGGLVLFPGQLLARA